MPRTLIVTNLSTHYRRPLYLRLASRLDVRFVFYSDGGEWYWQSADSGIEGLAATRLKGRWIGRTRITPGLVPVMLRDPYDVCISSLNGKFALPVSYLGARLRRKGWVLWAGMWEHPTSRVHRISRRPTRFLYRHADAVLTYGRHVSTFVISEGADPSKVIEAPQAVDMDRFTDQGRSMCPEPVLRIGYVGRFEHWKGPLVLIAALAELAKSGVAFDARLAGAGEELEACRSAIEQADLTDRVSLVGRVANEDLPFFYRSLDAVVIPSIATADVTEPWSLAVNEAMGCGCLVVASDAVGAVADGLVSDGITGRVVPAGDPNALASALAEAARDPEGTERLRRAGNRAVQDFTYEAAAEAFSRAVQLSIARRRR